MSEYNNPNALDAKKVWYGIIKINTTANIGRRPTIIPTNRLIANITIIININVAITFPQPILPMSLNASIMFNEYPKPSVFASLASPILWKMPNIINAITPMIAVIASEVDRLEINDCGILMTGIVAFDPATIFANEVISVTFAKLNEAAPAVPFAKFNEFAVAVAFNDDATSFAIAVTLPGTLVAKATITTIMVGIILYTIFKIKYFIPVTKFSFHTNSGAVSSDVIPVFMTLISYPLSINVKANETMNAKRFPITYRGLSANVLITLKINPPAEREVITIEITRYKDSFPKSFEGKIFI